MPDWRILAASFVALLFISGIFITGFGIRDFVTSIGEKIEEWTGSSPFGGFFSSTPKKSHEVEVVIYPDTAFIDSQTAITLTSETLNLENFRGTINMSFPEKKITLQEQQTDLRLGITLGPIRIENVRLASFTVENTSFNVKPDISAETGKLEMTDFSGTCLLDENSITFRGNVSMLRTEIGDRRWELT